MAGETNLYISQMLQNLGLQQVQKQAQQEAEEREIRVRTKLEDLDFEKQKKIRALAVEEQKRAKQEELGREAAFNATYGANLKKHAHLLSDDPEEQQQLRGIGQVMQETGMSSDVIMNYLRVTKETAGGRKAKKEETYITQLDTFSDVLLDTPIESLKDPTQRTKLMSKHLKGLPVEQKNKAIDMVDKMVLLKQKSTLAGKMPPEIQKAHDEYNRAVLQMHREIAKGDVDEQELMGQFGETINANADVVENWRTESGLSPLGLVKVEPEEVPAGFLSRVFGGKKTKTQLKVTKPGKETAKSAAKPTAQNRILELKKANPNLTNDEIADKLLEEGY